MNKLLFLLALASLTCSCLTEGPEALPSDQQMAYQEMEFVGFIHFTMNTFTDLEWGYGDEDPAMFNPRELDAEQWVKTAKAAGMKELILTAKHHDGFCLWPSAYTGHSIENSPYKEGRGDLVREFTEACRKHGLKAGLYLSPWDRNHPHYGTPAYIDYYRNQLEELLTGYGEINEIWFDGANGGDGYYGGAREERKVDKESYYDWPTTMAMVKEWQPGIQVFSDAGPDLRWVGNEHGHAGETFWSPISTDQLVIGASDPDYLNQGEPEGDAWIVGQCDVSIRPGWFYHAHEDSLVKSPRELLDIWYKSVGRNGVLLLNLPPDRRGLIHENDVRSLLEFRSILDESFATNLAMEGHATSASHIEPREAYKLELSEAVTFDRMVLMEDIARGQRIAAFRVESMMPGGDWTEIARGTTMGYKRILKVAVQQAQKIRVVVEASTHPPFISNVELYLSSPREQARGI